MLHARGLLAMMSIVGPTALHDAVAQGYPARPIRVITAEPGGGNDFAARTIGQAIAPRLGQQWVVDNRGGAGGMIAAEIAAKAAPDGYTLLVYASNIWIIPLLRRDINYSMAAFAPITWVARAPNILVVHPSLPVASVPELIEFARAQPGKLSYASGGAGATTHLAAELFKSMAKVDIVQVAYKAMHMETPIFEVMGAASVLGLVANGACLSLLWRHRNDDVNMSSVWHCSRNDIASNLSVLSAAGGVWVTGHAWPDLAIGFALAVLFFVSAFTVLREALRQLAASRVTLPSLAER